MIRFFKFNLGWLTLILVSCCGDYIVENHNTALLAKEESGNYELTLTGTRCVGGHDPISAIFKSKTEENHYIYTTKRTGTLYPDDFTLSSHKGELKAPYPYENIKGTLVFNTQDVFIQLEVPNYNKAGELTEYVPYEFNGKYKLIE
ncbi:MAG: hypothetical protein ISR96_00205 [Nitrospira sp.]|nr:hypothetical protein [Candidatus Brocadiales bacterium]MBL7047937.1 hypothetical protein [Nitrospira sp.]